MFMCKISPFKAVIVSFIKFHIFQNNNKSSFGFFVETNLFNVKISF